MTLRILTVAIADEQDVVAARQRARELAGHLGFDAQDQTRIATAVSEIARNAHNYAKGGLVQFELEGLTAPQVLLVRVSDKGPGIANLDDILAGRYSSETGMGLGLLGAQRLMDQCEISTRVGYGTTVVLKKLLPQLQPAYSAAAVSKLSAELIKRLPQSTLDELHRQNHELVRALAELRERQDDLARINRELEDTNRGVVALYAELDEKADALRRADEMKTRFLHQMSHEFRTPLNSVLALSRLLLDRVDGELNSEQEKQVQFIRNSADALTELVNDLLDLAKIEAGKVEVHAEEFSLSSLFSALRGMLRPLLVADSVELIFEEPDGLPAMYSDEGKVSQILRNFISNALKFTERGEVRVSARLDSGRDVVLSVADTGIGIAAADQQLVFEEFSQIRHRLQQRVKGTGLGLPLCRKLATLLGGRVEVNSELGVGSVFSAILPLRLPSATALEALDANIDYSVGERTAVLVVEDDPAMRLMYEKYLLDSEFVPVFANGLHEARQVLQTGRIRLIILDVVLHGDHVWRWLAELKGTESTRNVPVLIATVVDDERKGLALGADAYAVKPIEREFLLEQLERLRDTAPRLLDVLVIEDDESARYVLKKYLGTAACAIREAATGYEGMAQVREQQPDLIFLDLNLPDANGANLLSELKAADATRDIPVVIFTSQQVSAETHPELHALSHAILYKENLSRASVLGLLPGFY